MSTRPLQVYLDSSDYSRFADVERGCGTDEDESLLSRLCSFVSSGDVCIPFSGLHVIEAAPRMKNSPIAPASARLTVMDRLACRNAFRGWTELPSIDVFHLQTSRNDLAFIKPVNRPVFHGRSSNGEWFPGLPALFNEIGDTIKKMHIDPLSLLDDDKDFQQTVASLNRAQRREMKLKAKKWRVQK
jgi:uncharacterized protein (DUF58 family)